MFGREGTGEGLSGEISHNTRGAFDNVSGFNARESLVHEISNFPRRFPNTRIDAYGVVAEQSDWVRAVRERLERERQSPESRALLSSKWKVVG